MIHVSAKLDYGIIILKTLVQNYKQGPVSLRVIAQQHRLPYRYLTRIVRPLVTAGILRSFEGVDGGYTLARKPSTITLCEVIEILEPTKHTTRCAPRQFATCTRKHVCPMAPWWLVFDTRLKKLLNNITLKDLL